MNEDFRDEVAKVYLTALLNDPVWREEMMIDARKYRDSVWADLFAERAYMMADAMMRERTPA